MANHPNRRAINGALFESFLHVLSNTASDGLNNPSREELMQALREAALQLAIERVHDAKVRRGEWVASFWPLVEVDKYGHVINCHGERNGVTDAEANEIGYQIDRFTRAIPGVWEQWETV